jgi:hypothetical protein
MYIMHLNLCFIIAAICLSTATNNTKQNSLLPSIVYAFADPLCSGLLMVFPFGWIIMSLYTSDVSQYEIMH